MIRGAHGGEPGIAPQDRARDRKEILEIFAKEMYGQPPPPPETLVTELVEEGVILDGLGIRRQYKMWFRKDKSGPVIDWIVFIPNRIQGMSAKKSGKSPVCENTTKVPVILSLNYRGNEELVGDEEVLFPSNGWTHARTRPDFESRRGWRRKTNGATSMFPLDVILARGYAAMSACYEQVSPDINPKKDPEELAYTGVFSLWPKRDPARDDNTTALARGHGRFRAASTTSRRTPLSTRSASW